PLVDCRPRCDFARRCEGVFGSQTTGKPPTFPLRAFPHADRFFMEPRPRRLKTALLADVERLIADETAVNVSKWMADQRATADATWVRDSFVFLNECGHPVIVVAIGRD